MPLDEFNLCEVCDDRIEEPRIAVGMKTCAVCAHADPNSPPWDIGPAEAESFPS